MSEQEINTFKKRRLREEVLPKKIFTQKFDFKSLPKTFELLTETCQRLRHVDVILRWIGTELNMIKFANGDELVGGIDILYQDESLGVIRSNLGLISNSKYYIYHRLLATQMNTLILSYDFDRYIANGLSIDKQYPFKIILGDDLTERVEQFDVVCRGWKIDHASL